LHFSVDSERTNDKGKRKRTKERSWEIKKTKNGVAKKKKRNKRFTLLAQNLGRSKPTFHVNTCLPEVSSFRIIRKDNAALKLA
jgi:hypothetical protein